MMVCCCALAGTEACEKCPQYIAHFGKREIGKIYIATTQIETPYISETIELKRGEWMPIIEGNEFGEPYQSGIYCSECGETLGYEANYCPNCGAKMKE